ncbi:hypothetical protein SpCBS45565_g04937 [Spizellomyces sp. 'palustris']|nr:hypothetical protein SpCBS45565_g04937 [Spizellomyces sp. 'palustris']
MSSSLSPLLRVPRFGSYRPFATSSTTPRGWRKYAGYFRDHPGSHLVSFALLHELTAVVPLPLIYLLLSTCDLPIPFPEAVLAEGNKRMSKMLATFGWGPIEEGSQVMLHMATSYALVKAAMPLRIGLCFFMTPWFARCVHITDGCFLVGFLTIALLQSRGCTCAESGEAYQDMVKAIQSLSAAINSIISIKTKLQFVLYTDK